MSHDIAHFKQVQQEADLLFSEAQVEDVLDNLAHQISRDYSNSNPLVLSVMVGAIVTAGKLLTRLNFPLQTDYIHATRYRGETSGGKIEWIARSRVSVEGRHVLVVDDIYDEGITLEAITEALKLTGAASVKSVVLANKEHNRKTKYRPEYIGLNVPDRYVFGYGMDYKSYLRNAPGIFAVKGM